jgi:hypothetical protein
MSAQVLRFPGPAGRRGACARDNRVLAEAYRFAARNPRFAYAGLDRAPGLTTVLFADRTSEGGFTAHVRENGVAHALDAAGAFLAGGKSLESVLQRVAAR